MDKVNDLERQIEALSPEELAAFRDWFAEFDARAWDHQLDADAASGKLDEMATLAREAHASGLSKKL